MSIDVDLRSLLRKLNKVTTRALNVAVGTSSSRGHRYVTPDHYLAALLDETDGDVRRVLSHFSIDEGRLKKLVTRSLEAMGSDGRGKPSFASETLDWLQYGWLHGSVELGEPELRSGALLLAVASHPDHFFSSDYTDILSPLSRETLCKDFDSIVTGSNEQPIGAEVVARTTPTGEAAPRSADSALGRFCIDLTAQARAGKIDPIFARDREIRQMVDILARRSKNNPIVVGEAGVGKTAVVEGLALRIVQDDVPEVLRGVEILTLDLGLLQAGAGVRGEFEHRVTSVMEEVKGSEVPVILFIDEAHNLIGAGGGQGQGDAANLIKPALARGELRTIAATTWAEYKLHIEKDTALERRFLPVRLDEPSEEQTVGILRGLKPRYEDVHGVTIRDAAVVTAVKLSSRYLSGRQLPDKAVDLLDTCAARVRVAQAARPSELEDLEHEIEALGRERQALERDGTDQARVGELATIIEELQAKAGTLEESWKRERDAVRAVLDLRQKLAESPDEELEQQLAEAMRALAATRDGGSLVPLDVDTESVAKTASDWTGIPLGNMVKDQARSMLEFEDRIRERIKGQDHALEAVGRVLRASSAGIADAKQPMGKLFFAGPSGVGKTETALGIADLLFGGERFMTTINMSEFQEKHTVSLLKGAPPGYEGYGKGGILTEAVRQRPYSVVLLDEVEKAHRDVMNLFFQVFDKGILTDATGRDVDFKNTIIILTSNLGTDVITQMCSTPVPPDPEELAAAVKPVLVDHFSPALHARWTLVPFLTLGTDVMAEIVRLKLDRVGRRLRESHDVVMEYNDEVVEAIGSRCTEVDTGARNVDHVVQASLLPQISTAILERMAEEEMPKRLQVGIASDGSFDLTWQKDL